MSILFHALSFGVRSFYCNSFYFDTVISWTSFHAQLQLVRTNEITYRIQMGEVVKETLERNPYTSTSTLTAVLRGAGYSTATPYKAVRLREDLEIERRRKRDGFVISEVNKGKRLVILEFFLSKVFIERRNFRVLYCQKMLDSEETFDKFVFTDESLLQLGQNGNFVYVPKQDKTAHVIPKDKFMPKLMIWSAISLRGKGPIVVFRPREKVDAAGYTEVLKAFFPWAEVRDFQRFEINIQRTIE